MNLGWNLWEVAIPLLAIAVLVFMYSFTRSLFPNASEAENSPGRGVEPSAMIYRGVSYERSPDPDNPERSTHNGTSAEQEEVNASSAPDTSQPTIPNSVVRLTYRGVPYIRFR